VAELATVAKVKDAMGISATTWDTVLGEFLERVEAQIKAISGRTSGWLSSNWTQQTEKFDGEDYPRIQLTYTPVDTGASLAITVDGTALASTDYTLDAATGELELTTPAFGGRVIGSPRVLPSVFRGPNPSFAAGFRNVSVTYTGGYGSTAIPYDLQALAIEGVTFMFYERNQAQGIQSQTHGDHSWTRFAPGTISLTQLLTDRLAAAGYLKVV